MTKFGTVLASSDNTGRIYLIRIELATCETDSVCSRQYSESTAMKFSICESLFLYLKLLVAEEREEARVDSMECDDNSMERISDDLVTFSQLPASRWKNLLNLDIIRVMTLDDCFSLS